MSKVQRSKSVGPLPRRAGHSNYDDERNRFTPQGDYWFADARSWRGDSPFSQEKRNMKRTISMALLNFFLKRETQYCVLWKLTCFETKTKKKCNMNLRDTEMTAIADCIKRCEGYNKTSDSTLIAVHQRDDLREAYIYFSQRSGCNPVAFLKQDHIDAIFRKRTGVTVTCEITYNYMGDAKILYQPIVSSILPELINGGGDVYIDGVSYSKKKTNTHTKVSLMYLTELAVQYQCSNDDLEKVIQATVPRHIWTWKAHKRIGYSDNLRHQDINRFLDVRPTIFVFYVFFFFPHFNVN